MRIEHSQVLSVGNIEAREQETQKNNDLGLSSYLFSECCGALEYYDKAFDRVTTRNERSLKSIKRIFHTVTTTDDPVIRKVQAQISTLICGPSHV